MQSVERHLSGNSPAPAGATGPGQLVGASQQFIRLFSAGTSNTFQSPQANFLSSLPAQEASLSLGLNNPISHYKESITEKVKQGVRQPLVCHFLAWGTSGKVLCVLVSTT